MRITSGILKGRTFNVPKEGVRPTTERTREAVFSSIAVYVPEARVLDLFAGSGGLGLEAWSRGAAHVTAVEKVSNHWKNLEKNFQTLEPTAGLGAWEAVRADVYEYLKHCPRPSAAATEESIVGAGGDRAGSVGFDLIFADPPYEEVDVSRLLEAVGDTLAPEGLLVFEMHKRDSYTLPPEWSCLKEKKYGSTKVIFLERTHE